MTSNYLTASNRNILITNQKDKFTYRIAYTPKKSSESLFYLIVNHELMSQLF